jgi:tetratricopeptide (TPR) repeat protein
MITSLLVAVLSLSAQPADAWHWQPVRDADREVLTEAQAALVLKSPSKAEALLRPVLVRDPACGPCRATLARALLLDNRADEAYPLLRDLLADHPRRHELQVEVAWAAFAAQEFEAAQRAALTAVARQPNNPDALNVLVQTLVRTGELPLAEKMIGKVEKHHAPSHIACLRVAVLAERNALDKASKALELCRSDDDDHLVGAAEHRLASITGDPATYLTERSARLAAASPTRKVMEAVNLHTSGRHAQAEKLLVPYVKRYPKDLYARGVLGVVRLELGKTDLARRDLEACLSGRTWIATATDGSLSGILTQSAEQQLFINLQRFATALARLHLEAGDIDKAMTAIDAGARLYRETPDLIDAKARVLFAKGDAAAAWQLLADGVQRHESSTLLLDTSSAFVNKTPGAPSWLKQRLAEAEDWQVLYNLAVEEQHAERYPTCVKHGAAAARAAKPEQQLKTRSLLLACAVEARDVPTVADLLRDDDVVASRPKAVLRHAYFLSAEGHSDLALQAALRLREGGELAQQRLAAAATYHAELGQLDDAKRLLEGDGADPETLLFVGSSLIAADRRDEGKAMVRRACRRANKRMKADCKRLR